MGYRYIVEREEPFDFVSYILSFLDGKYSRLQELGISKKMIAIWILYDYVGEIGRLELYSRQLMKLGGSGLTLCVSCFDEGDETVILDEAKMAEYDAFKPYDVYSLRINMHDEKLAEQVNKVMRMRNMEIVGTYWYNRWQPCYRKFDVKRLIKQLERKRSLLGSIGIHKEDISLELTYHYCGQCNFEFTPNVTAMLGKECMDLILCCKNECVC